MKRSVAPWMVLACAAVSATVGLWAYDLGRGEKGGPPETIYETVLPREFQAILRSYVIDTHGLRARLEGVEELAPDTVIMTDTLVAPPDTVIRFATVDFGSGVIRTAPLFRRDSLYSPELRTTSFGDCDEGLSIEGGRIVCDPAVLGHLAVGIAVGATRRWQDPLVEPFAGAILRWTPSYRSPWAFSLMTDLDRTTLFGVRYIELF